jgi:alpha-L-arabinofuranosidase
LNKIGNEDNLNNGLSSYNSYRFTIFYNAIIAKYPNMKIIASTTSWTSQSGSSLGDDHEYNVS